MFNLGDKVVYPGHGVAQITRIVQKVVGKHTASFYELTFINKGMTILVPTQQSNTIRSLSSQEKVNDVFTILAQSTKKLPIADITTNWKQRNKEYQLKLRSGNLKDISEIYRELKQIEQCKELSFCEKNLLHQTESLLVEEISLVKKLEEQKAIEHLRSFFGLHFSRGYSTKVNSV